MMTNDQKFCKDCTHYMFVNGSRFCEPYPMWPQDTCRRNVKRIETINIVSGIQYEYAGTYLECRSERSSGECGPEGKYWEAKT